jgi:hypothetical protein
MTELPTPQVIERDAPLPQRARTACQRLWPEHEHARTWGLATSFSP